MEVGLLLLVAIPVIYLIWRYTGRGNRSRTKGTPFAIDGNGRFSFEIVGESYHQDALERIAGRTYDGAEHECLAELIPERHNRHDPNAVRIEIDGHHVGYLSRKDAAAYHKRLEREGLSGRVGRCRAMIIGGWDRGGGDRGHFGVKLDMTLGKRTRFHG